MSILHVVTSCHVYCFNFLGSVCLLSGVIITTVEIVLPNSFSTVLEVDYDTPYDRHIIIEDSHGRRYQKKRSANGKLEEPSGNVSFGRILRRLSSKTRDENREDRKPHVADNQSFELEQQSKSPWMYNVSPRQPYDPLRTRLPRSGSQNSIVSSNISRNVTPVHKDLSR